MEALTLTLFASVMLAVSAVLFFAWNVHGKSHEHTEHLGLLPLADDDASVAEPPPAPAPTAPKGSAECS